MSGDTSRSEWATTEDRTLIDQYQTGISIKAIRVPGRTMWAVMARTRVLIRAGVLIARGGSVPRMVPKRNYDRAILLRESASEGAPKRKQRTCLACGCTFLSAHAGNRLCERHNGASATPWESGYRVARVRVSA